MIKCGYPPRLTLQGDTALHYAYRSSSSDVVNLLEPLDVKGIPLQDIKNDVRICT